MEQTPRCRIARGTKRDRERRIFEGDLVLGFLLVSEATLPNPDPAFSVSCTPPFPFSFPPLLPHPGLSGSIGGRRSGSEVLWLMSNSGPQINRAPQTSSQEKDMCRTATPRDKTAQREPTTGATAPTKALRAGGQQAASQGEVSALPHNHHGAELSVTQQCGLGHSSHQGPQQHVVGHFPDPRAAPTTNLSSFLN